MFTGIATGIDKINGGIMLDFTGRCQLPILFSLRISAMRCTFSAFTSSSSVLM